VSYAGHAGGWNPKYRDENHYDYKAANKGLEYLLNTIANREDVWPNRKFIFFQIFCSDGSLIIDRLLRTETLDKDMSDIAKEYNLKYNPNAKKQRVGKHKDYRKYYTDKMIDLVNATWSRELKVFGYNFEGCNLNLAIIKNKINKAQKKNIKYLIKKDQLILG